MEFFIACMPDTAHNIDFKTNKKKTCFIYHWSEYRGLSCMIIVKENAMHKLCEKDINFLFHYH